MWHKADYSMASPRTFDSGGYWLRINYINEFLLVLSIFEPQQDLLRLFRLF